MLKLLNGNEWYWRLLRTIIQGLLGVIVANADMIIDQFSIDPFWKVIIVAVVMAVLSPIMAELGRGGEIMAQKRAAAKAAKASLLLEIDMVQDDDAPFEGEVKDEI